MIYLTSGDINMKYTFYKVIRFIIRPFFYLIHNPKIEGLDNIPKSGAVILAGNHTGNLDALLMIYGPNRVVHMMAKKELFSNFITKFIFKSMACISVNRSIHDENAKSEAMEVLKNNEVLGIFPEGTVNKTDKLILPFKFGAVSFAKKTGCPIVPLVIKGKYTKRNISIRYGKPYYVKDDLEKENKKLENIISDMLKGEK